MKRIEIMDLLAKVKYKKLKFYVGESSLFLQVASAEGMRGRKWFLSQYMTESEVIQTALMAVLAWEEHEAREAFLFMGQPIFRPHYNVFKLVHMCETTEPDRRNEVAYVGRADNSAYRASLGE